MKQLEEKGMEELVKEANCLVKRIEEIETADKKEKQKIAELQNGIDAKGRKKLFAEDPHHDYGKPMSSVIGNYSANNSVIFYLLFM